MKQNDFEQWYDTLLLSLASTSEEVPMFYWQSQQTFAKPGMTFSRELRHVHLVTDMPPTMIELQALVSPNLPWAEDHLQERIGGLPLNPPPSEAWWPFAQQGNKKHKEGEKFSHTYPERIWPKQAGYDEIPPQGLPKECFQHHGIRYGYGDLNDIINLLVKDPFTRQAYLPIWFPEDTGATDGQRVPCTLGYHFLVRNGKMDISYSIRSCDLFRHFRDDVYMAGRLLQWVCSRINDRGFKVKPGLLVMNISSLHIFEGDLPMLKLQMKRRGLSDTAQ